MNYTEGKYYRGLGYYIGIRTTHYPPYQHKESIMEHLFNTKQYDQSGVARLNRIKI